jgi:hypothetical protein
MLCGQAMMAAADTAMVLALISAFRRLSAMHDGADEYQLSASPLVGPTGRGDRGHA